MSQCCVSGGLLCLKASEWLPLFVHVVVDAGAD